MLHRFCHRFRLSFSPKVVSDEDELPDLRSQAPVPYSDVVHLISDTEDTVDTVQSVDAGSTAEQVRRADQEREPNENTVEEDGKVNSENNIDAENNEGPIVITQITT